MTYMQQICNWDGNFRGSKFQLTLVCIADSRTALFSRLFKNTSSTCSFAWIDLFDNSQFWLKLVRLNFCIMMYSFVCQFSFHSS